MSALKANGLLKFVVPLAIGLMVFVGVFAFKSQKSSQPRTSKDNIEEVIYDLTEAEQKDLGLTAGDTPYDTLKTILSTVKKTQAEVKTVREKNEKLTKENNALKADNQAVNQRIDTAVEENQQTLTSQFEEQLAHLRQEIEERLAQPQGSVNSAYPIQGSEADTIPTGTGGIRWIEPSDKQYTDAKGNLLATDSPGGLSSFPNVFKKLDDSPLGSSVNQVSKHRATDDAEAPQKIPYYTVPQNSTLMGAVAMTALLGRVPVDGSVTDPYPFKILIGAENLIANGIELPDVEGAIVSGSATGDWTLSCVKGKVDSMTFVFADGRIATTQQDKGQQSGNGIGWLSNPQGVPCIPGERKTNAPEYLSSQFLLAGASAAAQGLAQGQTTTVVEGNSVVGAVTGNQGKYVLGQALGGGLKETADWFKQRYGQTFDAVYVPPGQPIVVHITKNLAIDYDFAARKVKYSHGQPHRQLD